MLAMHFHPAENMQVAWLQKSMETVCTRPEEVAPLDDKGVEI
jgi:hypothetical protein